MIIEIIMLAMIVLNIIPMIVYIIIGDWRMVAYCLIMASLVAVLFLLRREL